MTRKLLFAHDDRVTIDGKGVPSSFNYTRHLIDRYRYLADQATFAVRCSEADPVRWYDDATIACIPEMKHGMALARYGAARRTVEKLVADHDVVVARLPSLIGSWALRAAWRHRKPVIIEFVGCPWDALWNHSLKGKLVTPFFWAKNRVLVSQAEYVVYVTEHFLQNRYPTSGFAIACSDVEVELVPDEQLAQRRERFRQLGSTSPFVLGTIANLDVRYKGHDLVIRALAALGDSGKRFIYRMIGPGDPGRLWRLGESLGIQDQLEFVGGLSREAIPGALDEIDVYIQPSRQEGLPRAMIEAMARGCVVLGARTGGIPELLDSEWVFPSGDWKAISDRLKDISKADLDQASQRNHAVAAGYQLDVLNERRQKFYDRFLAAHGMAATRAALE